MQETLKRNESRLSCKAEAIPHYTTKNPDGTVNTEHLDAFARTVKIWRGEE